MSRKKAPRPSAAGRTPADDAPDDSPAWARRDGEDADAVVTRLLREMKAAGRRDFFQHVIGPLERQALAAVKTRRALLDEVAAVKRNIASQGLTATDRRVPAELRELIRLIDDEEDEPDAEHREVVRLFEAIRLAMAKRMPEVALVGAFFLGKFVQQQGAALIAKEVNAERMRKALARSIEARRGRHAEFAAAWKASTVPERNRAAALAKRFGWTPKHAREVANELGLRN